jgi:hypothetical protein
MRRRCPSLCERRGTRLAQSVGRTMTQVRLITPITHSVAETSRGVRLPVFGDQERQVFRTSRRNGGAEIGMQRNVHLRPEPGARSSPV